MSRLLADRYTITEKRFLDLPAIGSVPAVIQAAASDDALSTRSGSESIPNFPRDLRKERCLIRNFFDLTNQLAHFVPAVCSKKAETTVETKCITDLLQDKYGVIPLDVAQVEGGFNLDHLSNRACEPAVSIELHKHHDVWATIAISPSLHDLLLLEAKYRTENEERQRGFFLLSRTG
ncbi:hypothetical protein B0H17DRAFT_1133554 [Mycena rosella]|uniref:Uncharacterized protein n=1 Tax=Mycena rosella TaxID=1033263 RepID=A0AAD7GHY9_MYCRO|nr:hypothetical protein B0H17DRAFT_1133554 [Mycena rosella]